MRGSMLLTASAAALALTAVPAFGQMPPGIELEWITTVHAQASEPSRALERFRQQFPYVSFLSNGTRITRIYGPAFGAGDSPVQVAREFLARHAGVLGGSANDLEPLSLLEDARPSQPVMFDFETGTYKFTLVYYSQFKRGIPVFRSDVRLLVRNDPGYPLVLVSSSLRELADFTVGDAIPPVRYDRIENAALDDFPRMINLSDPELVIWAGVEDMVVEPRIAVSFIADSGSQAEPPYERWLFVADAQSGEILYKETQIFNIDVVGNVGGNANFDDELPAGNISYDCSPEAFKLMPFARVWIVGGAVTNADASGNFVITNPGSSQVTVRSQVRGIYFDVDNASGSDHFVEMLVTPPGNITLTHSPNSEETYTAEVNAYIHANIVRDFVLAANPAYPIIAGEEQFRISVNRSLSCNASYAITEIRISKGGGSLDCSNWAFGDVLYHEYGHHAVRTSGSPQGAYGEGIGDSLAAIILDRPEAALGYLKPPFCDLVFRTAANDCLFDPRNCSSCGATAHACGTLLSGCIWDTRNQLALTLPTTEYQELLRDLTVNSILEYTGSGAIDPNITIDFWTLDDDNADISDGTPHFNAIYCGFAAHKMIPPGFRKGDMNCDEVVNGGDIDAFFLALGDPQAYVAQYPNCNIINGDIDGDGALNGGDITPFFNCVAGEDCCPSCLKDCVF